MSREVRRVPLDWQHPTEPNPYWREQAALRRRRGDPEWSPMHAPDKQFVGLRNDDYDRALSEWEQERDELAQRSGHGWELYVEYHLTGWAAHEGDVPTIHPWWTCADGMQVLIRDEDHLYELVTAYHESERPDPSGYMPTWDVPEGELGWCLYETVSEGTPVTPVFPTAADLIDYLTTVGPYPDGPMRRAAAEWLVGHGSSFGTFLVIDGRILDSSMDADIIANMKESGPA